MKEPKDVNLDLKSVMFFLSIGLLPMGLATVIFSVFKVNIVSMVLMSLVAVITAMAGYQMARTMTNPIHEFLATIDDLTVSNQDLARRTQEQSFTLEEIVATIEEVNSWIQQTSVNTDLANNISQSTLEIVKTGEKAASETLEAMNQISSSSRQIREIVGVVNDIASQTNLLAINAAVEAVRAGEQGKGFAIVAAEIKNLARRSTESAKEIEKLIRESMERIDKGNQVVQQSSETLQQIVVNTVRTSDVIGEVAGAVREQAAATQQIEASLDQLNKLTMENVSLFNNKNVTSLNKLKLLKMHKKPSYNTKKKLVNG